MKYFGLLVVFLCLLEVGLIFGHSDASMYFEGSGNTDTDLPIDDADRDQGSGAHATEGPTPDDTDIETIDIDDEPEVSNTGKGGKTKNVIIEDNDGDDDDNEADVDEIEPVDMAVDNEELEDEQVDADLVATGTSSSFLAAMIVGGCIGLLFAICVIMLLVYRMRKKDEGSYALEYGLDKKPQGNYEYTKGVDSKEYFA